MLANGRVRLLPNGVRCTRADHDCSRDKCDSLRSSSARALEINNTRLFEPYTILGSKQISEGPILVRGLAYKSGISMTSGS
jgi:hypothetical protein